MKRIENSRNDFGLIHSPKSPIPLSLNNSTCTNIIIEDQHGENADEEISEKNSIR